MKKQVYNLAKATQIALPTNHRPFFKEDNQNPLLMDFVMRACVILNTTLLLAKTEAVPTKREVELTKLMMHCTIESLPFHQARNEKIEWIKGIGDEYARFFVPSRVYKELSLKDGMPGNALLTHSFDYAASLTRMLGRVLYGQPLDDLCDALHISLECFGNAIGDDYLQYCAYALDEFERALFAPCPLLVAYPFAIDAQCADETVPEEVGDAGECEAELILTNYVPSFQCYQVWNASAMQYQTMAWDEGEFVQVRDDLDDLFDEYDEQAQTENERYFASLRNDETLLGWIKDPDMPMDVRNKELMQGVYDDYYADCEDEMCEDEADDAEREE